MAKIPGFHAALRISGVGELDIGGVAFGKAGGKLCVTIRILGKNTHRCKLGGTQGAGDEMSIWPRAMHCALVGYGNLAPLFRHVNLYYAIAPEIDRFLTNISNG